LFGANSSCQRVGSAEDIGAGQHIVGDEDGPIDTHRQRSPEPVFGRGWAHADSDDFTAVLLDEPGRCLDAVLVGGVDDRVRGIAE